MGKGEAGEVRRAKAWSGLFRLVRQARLGRVGTDELGIGMERQARNGLVGMGAQRRDLERFGRRG